MNEHTSRLVLSADAPRALVVYTSQHVQTKAIALALIEHLSRVGVRGELADADERSIPDITAYDVVVIGSSLHFGRHPTSVLDCIRRIRERLTTMPAFFFSVGDDDNGGIEVTGWRPTSSAVFDRHVRDCRRFRHQLGGHAPSATDLALAESSKVAAFAAVIAAAIAHRLPPEGDTSRSSRDQQVV